MSNDIVKTRTDERIASADGRMLHMTTSLPEDRPRAVVVIVHGFNSHSGYYPWVAERLTASGFAVYTFDLRGRGKSEGERYFIESFQEYQDDVHAVVSPAGSSPACTRWSTSTRLPASSAKALPSACSRRTSR